MARRLAYVLVAASVALNAWWLLGRGTAEPPTARPRGAVASGAAPAPVHAAPVPLPSVPASRLDECRRVLHAARRERDAARGQLAELATPQQRFASAARNESMKARLGEPTRAALAGGPGTTTAALECRGDVCQIEIQARTRAEATAATDALRTHPAVAALTDGFVMLAGTPTAKGFEVTLYIVTHTGTSATDQLEALIAEVRASPALARCASVGNDRGTLEARLTVADPPQIAIALGGSLEGTTVGGCIGDVLRAAVAAAQLLPDTTAGTVYASFPSPHGP